MTTTSAINEYFRRRRFKRPLIAAYERFEILSELGLQATLARLLQERLEKIGGTAKHYRVTCGVRLRNTNVAPDILIWRKEDLRFWIELKDTASFNASKIREDWEKLERYCCPKFYPTIEKGFFIYVARRGEKEFPSRLCPPSRRLYPIPIVIEHELGDKFDEWEKEYDRRAHHPPAGAFAKAVGR